MSSTKEGVAASGNETVGGEVLLDEGKVHRVENVAVETEHTIESSAVISGILILHQVRIISVGEIHHMVLCVQQVEARLGHSTSESLWATSRVSWSESYFLMQPLGFSDVFGGSSQWYHIVSSSGLDVYALEGSSGAQTN